MICLGVSLERMAVLFKAKGFVVVVFIVVVVVKLRIRNPNEERVGWEAWGEGVTTKIKKQPRKTHKKKSSFVC